MKSTNNRKTLAAYESGVNKYVAAMTPTVQGSVKLWIDTGLSLLPVHAKILEIGSAHGRDADYIESKGFIVERTDATQSFVDYLVSKGRKARLLNALTDDYGGSYDMIYANAVMLHFTQKEFSDVLQRIQKALAPDGLLTFSVKIGNGSGWSNSKLDAPRFYTYWQEEPLKKFLEMHNFKIIYWKEATSGHNTGDWFHVIAHA